MLRRVPKDPQRQKDKPPETMAGQPNRMFRFLLWASILTLVVLWGYQALLGGRVGANEIPYSEFRTAVTKGEVKSVRLEGQEVFGTYVAEGTDETETGATGKSFVTYVPSVGDEELLPLLEKNEVTVRTAPESSGAWLFILAAVVPALFFLGFFVLMARKAKSSMAGGINPFAKPVDIETPKRQDVTFEDVAGGRGRKVELMEVIEFLKSPEKFHRLGGKPPRGVLLVGPPGTGKTLMAKATAGEAGVPFASITGSDFMEMFVGVGASRVRELFKAARKSAPSIIFIDELDSVGRRRGAGLGGGHDEREQTLNQLLSEMDGFTENEGVVVMAATNRPDILDPALLRPGRFDRRVVVGLPGMVERREILGVHAKGKPLDESVDLDRLARSTPGFSGADLNNLLNESAILAARDESSTIRGEHAEAALDKILLGLKREGMALTKPELRLIAVHEAGHATVASEVEHADVVHKVSIVPRGRSLGSTMQVPRDEPYMLRREVLVDRLAVLMGGRIAERMVGGTSTSGAENDLKQAMKLARKMVLDWGMADGLDALAYGDDEGTVFLGEEISQGRRYSERTAAQVDDEIRSLIQGAVERAQRIIERKRTAFDRLVDELVEHEEMTGDDVRAVLSSVDDEPAPTPSARGREASAELS